MQDRILFGKDSYQPDEFPYYWRVFETNDEYFDYYRDYHAFWKLRNGLARSGAPEALLPERAESDSRPLARRPHRLERSAGLQQTEGARRLQRRQKEREGFSRANMANYLVTGGAGFIGSHLAEELLRRGHRVRIVDSLITGRRRNLEILKGAEFREGDLADAAVAERAVAGVDYVLHQAAIPSVPRSVKDPVTSNRANITSTLNVLVAARDAGVKRVVYAGSSSAYGNTPTLPKREDMPTNPLSPLRAAETGGRAALPAVHVALRAGDRDDPLLQRLRAAAGSRLSVSRCHLAVRDRAAAKTGSPPSTATASRRATSPTSPTSSTACCARARRRRSPAR